MFLTPQIKNIFLKMLLQIYSSKKAYIVNRTEANSRFLIIEIIGPPGIGKSTVLKTLNKEGIISSIPTPHWIIDEYLQSFSNFDPEYIELIQAATKKIKDLRRLKQHLYWLMHEKYLLETARENRFYMVDEGLGHHFNSALVELSIHNRDSFFRLMQNRAMIFLKSNPETITQRIIQRNKSSGIIRIQHRNKNMDLLTLENQKKLASKKKLFQQLSEINTPAIVVNTDLGLEQSKTQIRNFISKLNNGF